MEAGELLLKEKPLLTMTTAHTPKTLAKYVAELRQKVLMTVTLNMTMKMTTAHTPKTLAKYVAELRQKVEKC